MDKKNRAEKVAGLKELAKQKGYLTPEDILKAFPDAEASVKITEDLTSGGIILLADDTESIPMSWPEKTIPFQAPVTKELSDEESLRQYVNKLGEVQKLTDQEKETLIGRSQAGDKYALQMLLESYQPLVVHNAKKYMKKGLPVFDLIQEGNLGLMQALHKYKADKKTKFTGFANNMIRKTIKAALTSHARTVRLPKKIIDLIRKLNKASQKLAQRLNRTPKIKEIAAEVKMTEEEVLETFNSASVPISLETPLSQDQKNQLGDYVEDSKKDLLGKILQEGERELLLEEISVLSPLEQQVLSLHYGLIDEQEWSLGELAAFFNLEEKEILNIRDKALERLQKK
ncbi:sigma-70 family RNA polymerase sigma factor [Candidatus Margulisiibacteriota bacterium]